ncbi:hypothetical protein, partial [Candidatus Entotheonella palauensis]|uniref:hypothetical protein n=1 Tax=Candidatus Entotheonella palauensis TaxID=93172 RepID=UPI0011786780
MALVTQEFIPDTRTPRMLHGDITDQRAWMQHHVSPAHWLIPFPETAIAELDEALDMFDRRPQPVHTLTLDQFPNLTACRRVMAQVYITLYQTGMAIIDRVPVERYRTEQNKVIYWLLGQMLGRVVDQ